MAYTKFDEIAEKYRMFKDGEPVRCTERQCDRDGVLEADSILIVSGFSLTVHGKERIEKGEKLTNDDMKFMCYHIETKRYFWIKGSQLKKADDKEAVNVVNKYNRESFKEEMYSNVVCGFLFIMLLLFAIALVFFLLNKVSNICYDKMYNVSIFIAIISGFVLIIVACISSMYEYRKKKKRYWNQKT